MAEPDISNLAILAEERRRRRPPGGGGGEEYLDAPLVPFSDDALADALSACLGENWLCMHPGRTWYHWNGKVWRRDHKKRVIQIARRICRQLADELTGKEIALKRKVTSKERALAAVGFAESDPRHARTPDEFDTDPELLNTPGGIVDLRTGEIRAHDPAAMMSKITAVAPAGDCPQWLAFEDEFTGNNQIVPLGDAKAAQRSREAVEYKEWLRSFAGYSLTGSCEEEIFVFLFGKHGNTGKTTWQTVMRHILGDYAIAAPVNIFIVTGGERHPTELADFCGARLVIVGETGKDDSFDEAKLKKLTGRDPIRARFMREDFFEFEATHKLAFAGNFLPKLRSADHAMRRRTRICPFDFPHARVDKTRAAALKREGGGILKLLIAAAVKWHTEKLTEPAVIKAATDRYFETANPLRRWLRERCELGRALEETSGRLFSDYATWAADADEKVLSQRRFCQELNGIEGIQARRNKVSRYFSGVRLHPQRDEIGGDDELPASRLPAAPAAGDEAGPAGMRCEPASVPDRPGPWVDDPAEDWPRE